METLSLKSYSLYFILSFLLYFTSCLSNWKIPDNSRCYHEVTFLTSHNSFSSEEDGYVQPQQKWHLENQLKNGVRGFMLDTHYASRYFNNKKKIQLCHRNCTLTQMILRPLRGKPMSFKKSLKIFKNFLETNRQEIVTLFLENYTNAQDIDQAIESTNIQHLILTPKIWNSENNNGWPTLKWMQENNKRLVIFNQRGQTKYTYDEWRCHCENQYGTIDINKSAQERAESRQAGKLCHRYLHVLNYFPHFYVKPIQRINFKKINSQGVRKILNRCLNRGIGPNKICQNRYPNFIAVDFVNDGNLINLINEINNKAADKNLRKKMYCKLPKQLNTK